MKSVFTILISILVLSCGKKEGIFLKNPDRKPPTIIINSPANNQQFSAANPILIAAIAKDDVVVEEMAIQIRNKARTALLKEIIVYPDEQTGKVFDSYQATAGITYIIRFVAIDHARNIATTQIEVTAY
jgi:phosphate starvation-inducible membrane PsiE